MNSSEFVSEEQEALIYPWLFRGALLTSRVTSDISDLLLWPPLCCLLLPAHKVVALSGELLLDRALLCS